MPYATTDAVVLIRNALSRPVPATEERVVYAGVTPFAHSVDPLRLRKTTATAPPGKPDAGTGA
jgi:hypothetical protein